MPLTTTASILCIPGAKAKNYRKQRSSVKAKKTRALSFLLSPLTTAPGCDVNAIQPAKNSPPASMICAINASLRTLLAQRIHALKQRVTIDRKFSILTVKFL